MYVIRYTPSVPLIQLFTLFLQLISQPIVKPKVTISDTQTTSKSEAIGAATLSKRKEEVQTSSLFANKASLIPCEQPAQEELPSDCSSNLVQTASDIIARRKSERRKSYTSLLMTRSKVDGWMHIIYYIFLVVFVPF